MCMCLARVWALPILKEQGESGICVCFGYGGVGGVGGGSGWTV